MSFGWSVSDIALLVRLAHKTAEGARAACGEYDELAREVTGLHNVLNRLNKEARKPSSFLNRPGETYKEELEPLSSRCKHLLTRLDAILVKYNALREREGSARKLWKKVRFGTGAIADVADLRSQIATCTASLSLFLNLVSLGTVGEVEMKMNQAGGDLTDIKIAVNGITARLSAVAGREGSVLTAYTNDDKDAWRELRRGLVKDGFRGSLVRKHMKTIMAYVKELGSRGALDGLDELGCEEGSYMPSRQNDAYRIDREGQAALTTPNPKTTGSSNQAQPIHPQDDSMSISSTASSDSSSTDYSVTGRPSPLQRGPYVESACETADEDGHVESPGTASSKESYLHTSHSADDMAGQEPSDVDLTCDLLSLDNGEELPQQEVADQREYKQDNDRPRSTEAWTASDINQAHLNSKAAFETTERKDEDYGLWSNFVDPCWSRIVLYQISLEIYQYPAFIADNTSIHPFLNNSLFKKTQRHRQLQAMIRFRAGALKISRPNLPDRGTLLSLVVEDGSWAYHSYPKTRISVSDFRILDQFMTSCLRLLRRLGQCFKRSKSFKLNVTTTESTKIQPEQINALCVAFMVELTHHQIRLYNREIEQFVESGWALAFERVIQDVEVWVDDFERDCFAIAHRIENMPGLDKY